MHSTAYWKEKYCICFFLVQVVCMLCLILPAWSQTIKTDSLKQLLKAGKEDTTIVNIVNSISAAYVRSHPDSAIEYAQKALSLSEELMYDKGLGQAYKNLGKGFARKGENKEAIDYLTKGLQRIKGSPNEQVKGELALEIANIYSRQGNTSQAIHYYDSARNYFDQVNDHKSLASLHFNIACVYHMQMQWDIATQHYRDAIRIGDSLEYLRPVAQAYLGLGQLTIDSKRYEGFDEFLSKSMMLYQKIGDEIGAARAFTIMGMGYMRRQHMQKAEEALLKSIKIEEPLNDDRGLVFNFNLLVDFYISTGNASKAEYYLDRAASLSTKLGLVRQTLDDHWLKAKIDSVKGEYLSAITHFHEYHRLKDSIYSYENNQKFVDIEEKYEKIQMEKKLLRQSKELELHKAEVTRRNVVLGLMSVVILSVTIGLYILWIYFKEKKNVNQRLLLLNTNIRNQNAKIKMQAKDLQIANEEVRSINENLEMLVRQRTAEIEAKNKKLMNYAFMNAHKVRAPVARILGLIGLIKTGAENGNNAEIVARLDTASGELDQIVREMSKILSEEDITDQGDV